MAKNGRYETDGHGANYLFAVKPKDRTVDMNQSTRLTYNRCSVNETN